MTSIASSIIHKFNSIIDSLPADPDLRDLLSAPEKNFIRNSKLGLIDTVRFVLGAGPTTLKNELRSFYVDP